MKKVLFEGLKPGQYFRHKRKLYIKDKCGAGIHLASGTVKNFDSDGVIPVKVNIRIK